MDHIHAALVSELVRLLCIELDLHYDDEHLADGTNDDAIRTVQEAGALLLLAEHQPPEILDHLLKRVGKGQQNQIASSTQSDPAP